MKQKNKRAQAQVITVVLLILISIVAVTVVSTVIIRMVRRNLQGTECFKALGELEIITGNSYFDSSNNMAVISIERGQDEEINITGISISIGTGTRSKSYRIEHGAAKTSEIGMFDTTGDLEIPGPNEIRTYNISVVPGTDVTQVIIAPVMNGRLCDKADEKDIEKR